MSKQDWIDLVKAGVRGIVTVLFAICWLFRYFEYGDAGMDTFTLILAGLLAWYFGEAFMNGVFNHLSIKTSKETK